VIPEQQNAITYHALRITQIEAKIYNFNL